MAQLKDVPAFILPYKDRTCMFCGGEITHGAFWEGYEYGICVGVCCKHILIHMYKDIILERDCGRMLTFMDDVNEDAKKCYDKTINQIIRNEKLRIEQSKLIIKEYEEEHER